MTSPSDSLLCHNVDRRTFLKLLSLASSLPMVQARRPTGPGKKVVILGAGLAGLAAGWNLVQRGYDVIIVEGQGRAGGRVKTVRKPFQKGGYAEAGAVRIPSNHQFTMKYIKLMGLASKLRDYADPKGAHLWHVQGKRFITPTGEWPLDGLTPAEKADPFGQLMKYWGDGFKAVGNPLAPDFPSPAARELDAYRMDEYFKRQGASDAWIQLLYASEGHFGDINALWVTAVEGALLGSGPVTTYGLVGGNDQLPRALATSLGSRVRFRTRVDRIAHTADGVTITVTDASGQHEIAADYCICTLPFPLLREVAITPSFSETKMDAIRSYGLADAARVSLQTRTRFWEQDPLGRLGGLNMVGTDTTWERIWNTSALQPDKKMGMLHVYMFEDHAQALGAIPPAERVAKTTDGVAPCLPQLGEQTVASSVTVWHEDPWARGAVALLHPHRFETHWPAARRAEGRVHFAGEHTSVWIGFQNGALESAERCVSEITGA